LRSADPSTRSPNGDQVQVVRPQILVVAQVIFPFRLVPVGVVPFVWLARPVGLELVRQSEPRRALGVRVGRLVLPEVVVAQVVGAQRQRP
jgi:hypothetical protein